MLSTTDRNVATTFKQRMRSVSPVLDMRVFGSRARGDADSESDLDICIELESVTPQLRLRISEVAWEVGLEMDRVISTLVVTREQLEHGPMGVSATLTRNTAPPIGRSMINESSGNVFSDLGFEPGDAAILQMRANLMSDLRMRIEASGMTHTEAAHKLGIAQSRVSDLMRGKWKKFSLEMLITLEARLGRQMQLEFAAAPVAW